MNGKPSKPRRATLIPTNTVTTKDGKNVRARIDPTLPVTDVIQQLCHSLKLRDPPLFFALRDNNDELVTDENLRKKIRDKVPLKLVNAPVIEAAEIVRKLVAKQEPALKLSLHALQKLIHEEQFAHEFLSRDGLVELVEIINGSQRNALAYALTAMQHLMELDYGWSTLEVSFVRKVTKILSLPTTPINVCRPATAVLKRLVEADPNSAAAPSLPSSSRNAPPSHPPGSIWRYGFDVVWDQMQNVNGMLDVVVQRLSSPESGMAASSMMLINSLLAHATQNRWEELNLELDRLNVRRAVVRLMSAQSAADDLTSSILDFQTNLVRLMHRRKMTYVDAELPAVQANLQAIWTASKLDQAGVDFGGAHWTLLGFESENVRDELARVGLLGLDCLKSFVDHDTEFFAKVVLEQISRPVERRCPIARASDEVVELLSEHWAVFAPGYSTSTAYQPYFFSFNKIHTLATKFFIRMWNESAATYDDFARVSALVHSQIRFALRDESNRQWHEVEHDFLESEYRDVRERQTKELELEDELLNKPPIRNLRAELYKESYEFVRQQRIRCLMEGAWFINALPVNSNIPVASSSRESLPYRKPLRPWRFFRLDKGMKYLHYVDSAVKIPIKPGLDDLPEKIDVSSINEISTNTGALPPNVTSVNNDLPSPITGAPLIPSPLSFSLLSIREGSLADQVAENASRFSDWTDALNMIRPDGGHVNTKETADFVQALTEIGLKIKLLDLSGEKVDIPTALHAGPPPEDIDFYFADPSMYTPAA